MSARFCGTGSCVPDYVMDNDGVAEFVETSDSWIRERTGIARRHIAVKETTVSMANEAAKRMGEPVEKFPMNMEEYGNTSSASIPILLDEMNRNGRLKRGQKIVLAGFGAGLTWGATIIEW